MLRICIVRLDSLIWNSESVIKFSKPCTWPIHGQALLVPLLVENASHSHYSFSVPYVAANGTSATFQPPWVFRRPKRVC